ncbi:MAG TPA: CRISPR system precrRNA processing endoribonuclease RAMP protein Cas6 [Candidatus Goldiibacteriota bacterium]|nr:CRISPR system precrRNA processing endoribonuclease RAMP protein Cas6 [Candidatus Goldiibacteriota bacterium]
MKKNNVNKMLSSIKVGCWRFVYEAANEGRLPGFKGSTIRGAFGMALRGMSCAAGISSDCRKCMLFENCIYALTFESVNKPEKNSGKFLDVYEYIPHPFTVSDKSAGKRDYKKGEKLEFEMMLVEPFIEKLPYYVYAFKNAAQMGLGKDKGIKFKLVSVRGKNGADIYDPDKDSFDQSYAENIVSAESVMAGSVVNKITVEMLSPVRIKSNEKITEKLDFKIFMTALLRRASGIASHYADVSVNVGAAEYLKDAEKVKTAADNTYWHDWERYSNRQKTKMNMGGVMGKIEFEGKELKKYLPLIRLGEVIKVGKGTSMGLGEYRVKTSE